MDKEEYAELHYLLAKLKYSFAEEVINVPNLQREYERLDDSIRKIMNAMIIINKEKD